MARVILDGKGQAVDGDVTSTGAVCIATGAGYLCDGLMVLRVGDPTTACPACGEAGTIVDGYTDFTSDGQYVAWHVAQGAGDFDQEPCTSLLQSRGGGGDFVVLEGQGSVQGGWVAWR